MPDSGPMVLAVEASLLTAPIAPEDAAAVALVKKYALLMDSAATMAAELRDIIPANADQRKQLMKMEAVVKAHTVASDLGPKLLAGLTALGMTVAGRNTAKGGKPDDGAVTPTTGNPAEDALRALRAKRGVGNRAS